MKEHECRKRTGPVGGADRDCVQFGGLTQIVPLFFLAGTPRQQSKACGPQTALELEDVNI